MNNINRKETHNGYDYEVYNNGSVRATGMLQNKKLNVMVTFKKQQVEKADKKPTVAVILFLLHRMGHQTE